MHVQKWEKKQLVCFSDKQYGRIEMEYSIGIQHRFRYSDISYELVIINI